MAAFATSCKFALFLVYTIPAIFPHIVPTEASRFRGDTSGGQERPFHEASDAQNNETVTEQDDGSRRVNDSMPVPLAYVNSRCPNQEQCCVPYGPPGPMGQPGKFKELIISGNIMRLSFISTWDLCRKVAHTDAYVHTKLVTLHLLLYMYSVQLHSHFLKSIHVHLMMINVYKNKRNKLR